MPGLKERTEPPVCEGLIKLVIHESFKKSQAYWEDVYDKTQEISLPDWRDFQAILDSDSIKLSGANRLSSDEEKNLFLYYNYAKHRYNQSTSNGKVDLNLWLSRVNECKAKLVQSNLGLVLSMAKRAKIPGVDFSELISEGNFAMLRAVEKFDVSRGFKFSTYACRSVIKAFNRMATNYGKHSSRYTLEREIDIDNSFSLDNQKQEKESRVITDLRELLPNAVRKGILSPVEYRIIKARYLRDETQTLKQLEDRIGLCTERIRQVERGALEKIRAELGITRAKNRKGILKSRKAVYYTPEQDNFIYTSMLHQVPISQIKQELIERWNTDRTKESIYEHYSVIRDKLKNQETASV